MRRRRQGRGTDRDRQHQFLSHRQRRTAIVRAPVAKPEMLGPISNSLCYQYRNYRGWGRDADADDGQTQTKPVLEPSAAIIASRGRRCLVRNMLAGTFVPLLFNFKPKQSLNQLI